MKKSSTPPIRQWLRFSRTSTGRRLIEQGGLRRINNPLAEMVIVSL